MGEIILLSDIAIQTILMTGNEQNPFRHKKYRKAVWSGIITRIEEKENVKKMPRTRIRYAVAAAVLIICTLAIIGTGNKLNSSAAITKSLQKIVNPTDKIYVLKMADGSKINLYPNSEIMYRKPFGQSDREINLTGKAFFEVAADKSRPFKVFTDSVITTALGTSFTIVSDSLPGEVNVFLHSGRVVVQQGNKEKKFYLAPGQQLSWNTHNTAATVKNLRTVIKPSSPAPVKKIARAVPGDFTLSFNQEALPGVLKKIASGFSLHLNYNPAELNSLYFSGTVKSTDSPGRILERIAALHDLSITQDKNGYRIRKN